MGNSVKTGQFLLESRLADAMRGDPNAYFDLGIAYSCGTGGADINLVEAHKWFNLAAVGGLEQGQTMRAEIAEDMTAREISEAQKQARAWIVATSRHAA
jgi:uncharacterized protein